MTRERDDNKKIANAKVQNIVSTRKYVDIVLVRCRRYLIICIRNQSIFRTKQKQNYSAFANASDVRV